VARALTPGGMEAVSRGEEVLRRIQIVRVTDRVLQAAGRMQPVELRSLEAIHLASARGSSVKRVVTYAERMSAAATAVGWSVAAPGYDESPAASPR
jgi:predicted nucleic acid-binding protein